MKTLCWVLCLTSLAAPPNWVGLEIEHLFAVLTSGMTLELRMFDSTSCLAPTYLQLLQQGLEVRGVWPDTGAQDVWLIQQDFWLIQHIVWLLLTFNFSNKASR